MFGAEKNELWVWTELLAFDNTLPDFGVKAYLDEAQKIPTGFSFMTNFDFVMMHDRLKQEAVLPPDTCSRVGHRTNGRRERQDWTNYQVRGLIAELHKYGIKAVFNFWTWYLKNHFRHEFLADAHPEQRAALISPMNDGRIMGDVVVEKLAEVLLDYGFDGWHAADSVAAPWNVLISPTDNLIRLFAEENKAIALPGFLLENADHDDKARLRKLQYLQRFCWQEWNEYLLARWKRFWTKAVETVHGLGKIVMVNSPNTKSVFGSLQYMNVDYRHLAELGIDYLIAETCTCSGELIWHNRPLLHEFTAMMSELTASMPGVKVLAMSAVRDTVEGFDMFGHSLPALERDLHMLNAQGVVENGELKRCTDGFVFCLGDSVDAPEWQKFHRMFEQSLSFDAVRNGELVWLLDPKAFDALHLEHHTYGTWSPSAQITVLKNLRSIDISTIAAVSELDRITQPLIVPNFHLLDKETQQRILARKLPLVLTGRFQAEELPGGAETICWKHNKEYFWQCVFLNWPGQKSGSIQEVRPEREVPNYNPMVFSDVLDFSLFREWYPHLAIPEEFWQATADRIRELLGPLPIENEDEGVQVYRQYAADGTEHLVQVSRREYYIMSRCRIEPADAEISIAGNWPKMPVYATDGLLSHGEPWESPVTIPPHGVVAVDIKRKQS